MASFTTAVLLVCFVYMVCGASVYKQYNIKKTPRDIRIIRRDVNIVKRSGSVPTFENETEGRNLQKNGSAVFRYTLKTHQGVFKQNVSDGNSFNAKMANIFDLAKNDWKNMRDVIDIKLCSYKYYTKCYFSNVSSTSEFYDKIIYLYTSRILYKQVNLVLRDYRNTENSLFGPYALMLNVILSQRKKLKLYQGTTYRGANFKTKEYTVNTIFTWTSFTSSSINRTVACNFTNYPGEVTNFNGVLFTIDNSADSAWRPRGIIEKSKYKGEDEYLYPAIAIFKITSVKDEMCTNLNNETFNVTGIHLSLQRGETEGSVNVAAIIRGTAGGVAFLAIVECVVVGVLLT